MHSQQNVKKGLLVSTGVEPIRNLPTYHQNHLPPFQGRRLEVELARSSEMSVSFDYKR
jgi:hypothetical protein